MPYAAAALRAMLRLGLLDLMFPEFQAIDSLVIRDFYHRYTVDEHSFMTLENLHRLRREKTLVAPGGEAATKNVGASSAGPGRTPFGPTSGPEALRAGGRRFAEILSEV